MVCLVPDMPDDSWSIPSSEQTWLYFFFFLPTFLAFLTGSCKLTLATTALPKRFAVGSVSYSTHLRNISGNRERKFVDLMWFYFLELVTSVAQCYSTYRSLTVTRHSHKHLVVFCSTTNYHLSAVDAARPVFRYFTPLGPRKFCAPSPYLFVFSYV